MEKESKKDREYTKVRGVTNMKNILFCSVGRRGELVNIFKEGFKGEGEVIVTENSNIAPAIYLADKRYIVPLVTSPGYIDTIIDICKKENISGITTLIDPEIEVLAENKELLEENGVMFFGPSKEVAEICFDKYKTYEFLVENEINTVDTYNSLDSFLESYDSGKVSLPVFIKPNTGSGSVGIKRIETLEELKVELEGKDGFIIQELMSGTEYDADIYVDMISGELVSAFTKEKLSTRIGGADKTISFKDERLFEVIEKFVKVSGIKGPADIDFFEKDGEYHLSEINPRFGGAYIHAPACGIDFTKLIINNLHGNVNENIVGEFEEDVLMMMYDTMVIKRKSELAKE